MLLQAKLATASLMKAAVAMHLSILNLNIRNLFNLTAAAEQIYIEHQLFTGSDAEFPIDIGIMLFDSIYADKGEICSFNGIMSFNIILQNGTLHRRESLYAGREICKKQLNARGHLLCKPSFLL